MDYVKFVDVKHEKEEEQEVKKPPTSKNMVNNPPHYQTPSGLEAIDVIEAFFPDSFHLGNAFKYIARAGRKGDYVEDLRKSIWYINREIDRTNTNEKEN